MDKLWYKLALTLAVLRLWGRFLRHFYRIRPSRSAQKGFIFPETDGRPLTIPETLYRTVTDVLLHDSIQFGQVVFAFLYPRVVGRILWTVLVPSRYVHRNISYKSNTSGVKADVVKEYSRCRLDIYSPEIPNLVDRPVILFFHGGAWAWGHKWEYAALGKNLTYLGAIVAVVNYRVYPLGNASDMVEDVIDAVVWARNNIHRYGGDPMNINLLGHSAGAHICAMAIASAAQRAPKELIAESVPQYGEKGKLIQLLQSTKSFTGISGVYDIRFHYSHESRRQLSTCWCFSFAK
eukprot:gb/GECG01013486.1/.p1 GENE.gb/GECG01013486.1/~~gb/GECG01013486.1/.p1  ORF type:complete len:292 (+),score=17.45 gb/GECG01013486.1/:1-876(+)